MWRRKFRGADRMRGAFGSRNLFRSTLVRLRNVHGETRGGCGRMRGWSGPVQKKFKLELKRRLFVKGD